LSISAADVKALRDRTNAPMRSANLPSPRAGGDMEKATDLLRQKMKNIQVARGGRETARVASPCSSTMQQGRRHRRDALRKRAGGPRRRIFVQLADEIANR